MRIAWYEIKQLSIYVILLILLLLAIDGRVNGLKAEINTVVRGECQHSSSAKILSKYNDFVRLFRQQQLEAERLNTGKHDISKATADAKYAARAESDEIPIPKQNCSTPLLK